MLNAIAPLASRPIIRPRLSLLRIARYPMNVTQPRSSLLPTANSRAANLYAWVVRKDVIDVEKTSYGLKHPSD